VQVERHELARDGHLTVVVGRHGHALSHAQPQRVGRVHAMAWQWRRLARDREGTLGIDLGALAVTDRAHALLPMQQVLERREELTERRQKTVTHPDRVPRRRIRKTGLVAEHERVPVRELLVDHRGTGVLTERHDGVRRGHASRALEVQLERRIPCGL
jgi:hypothetical protein